VELVEHSCNIIVPVAHRHLANDLDVFVSGLLAHCRAEFSHLEGGVHSPLPVDHEVQLILGRLVDHHDLLHDGANDPLLELHRAGGAVPHGLESFAQREQLLTVLCGDNGVLADKVIELGASSLQSL
jgi:hypothetical protein